MALLRGPDGVPIRIPLATRIFDCALLAVSNLDQPLGSLEDHLLLLDFDDCNLLEPCKMSPGKLTLQGLIRHVRSACRSVHARWYRLWLRDIQVLHHVVIARFWNPDLENPGSRLTNFFWAPKEEKHSGKLYACPRDDPPPGEDNLIPQLENRRRLDISSENGRTNRVDGSPSEEDSNAATNGGSSEKGDHELSEAASSSV